jgi:hypothetical protein
MIVASLMLVVAAVVLLVIGLVRLDNTLLYSSIVASALAALALIVGVRQLPAGKVPEADFDVRPTRPGWRPRPVGIAAPLPQSRPDAAAEGMDPVDLEALAEADPTVPIDEPSEQVISEQDAATIAGLRTEVVVIDGRPRYHLDECLHLLGFESQRLPAFEAVELGFTPCALCAPATALLEGRDGS